jgi:hypothetical protein
MATLIGLCIRVKLLRSLPERFKADIQVGGGGAAGRRKQQAAVAGQHPSA